MLPISVPMIDIDNVNLQIVLFFYPFSLSGAQMSPATRAIRSPPPDPDLNNLIRSARMWAENR